MIQHLHVFRLLLLFAVLFALALCLLRPLAQVILRRVAQFLHQARDLLFAGAIAHRLTQPFLRFLHAGERIADIAILQRNGQIPQGLRGFIPRLGREFAQAHLGFHPAQDHPQPQIRAVRLEKPFLRLVRNGAKDLAHALCILPRPKQVAAHLNDRRSKRIKESPRGQVHVAGDAQPVLPSGIGHFQFQAHGQVRPRVL